MVAKEVLRVAEENRIGISPRHLTVTVKDNPIINDVLFDLHAGELMAIMGGSGLGKTTLLNILSQRTNHTDKKLNFLGGILYRKADTDTINYSYMQQTDEFLPGLTVFETLKTQADLRMSPEVLDGAKVELINSLLDVLELNHKRDETIAAFSTHKTNLLGGEQRRVLVAIQLLSRPRVLFLDEPTTGLDTLSSLKLVQTLKRLASPEIGLTVVLLIHQPRPEIAAMFDKICLLLKGGRLIYFGLLVNLVPYFSGMGYQMAGSNHMDFIINLLVKDTTTTEKEVASEERIVELNRAWKAHQHLDEIDVPLFADNMALFKKHYPIPFWKEVVVLTKRTALLTVRDWPLLLTLNLGMAILAAITGWMFFQPDEDLAGIRTLTSSLYVMLEVVGFCPHYFELERLWLTDGVFFLREYSEGYVLVAGFVLLRRLGKLFLEDVPIGVIYGLISYFMFGLRAGGLYFGIYLTVCILINMAGMAMALVIFSLLADFVLSTLLYGALYQLQNLACGYFVNAKTMPVYVRWLKYCAYFWYAFGALMLNQYTDWMGDCEGDAAFCEQFSGNYQIEMMGFPQGWIGEPIGILVAFWVGFHIIAWVALVMRKNNIAMAKLVKNKIGVGNEGLPLTGNPDDKVLSPKDYKERDNVPLSVIVRNVTLQKGKKLTLLNDISATFAAGKISAIMGPLGGGKTTMLNYLSDRIAGRYAFQSRGDLAVEGPDGLMVIDQPTLKLISAYVTQNDLALRSTLTVRETLYFQAKLRIPVEQHHEIPDIVQRLIRDMGLVDCADTMIGLAYRKGISGGEKRRVSIAVQLLLRPKILFLDEPTLGLDLTTLANIVELLHRFADREGTTVIMTIHQPSPKLFYRFDSLLMLARGGRVVYNGPTLGIVPYFEKLGFEKSPHVGDADYLLDTIQSLPEAANTLVTSWDPHFEPLISSSIDLEPYRHKMAPFKVRIDTVCRRQMKTLVRDIDVIVSRAAQIVFLTVVHTLFFAPLRNGPGGIENRMGLIQEVLNLYFVGLLNNIAVFPTERDMFYQEYRDGVYGVTEFSISYFLNELPTEILPCIFFAVLIVFGVGLPRNAAMFFSMFCTGFMLVNTGELLGMIVNACFNHMGVATNVLTNAAILAIFMGGTMSLYMPGFFKGVNYINPMKYAVGICAKLGFPYDMEFDCGLAECAMDTGKKVLDHYNLDISLGAFFGGLIACLVVYRVLAVGLLWGRVNYLN